MPLKIERRGCVDLDVSTKASMNGGRSAGAGGCLVRGCTCVWRYPRGGGAVGHYGWWAKEAVARVMPALSVLGQPFMSGQPARDDV